ncbi:succinate dehydrogenase cytochrome b subunit [Paeniglutamicibacter cryotolerans]|uniref:Succinate dehydrogenase / fumarate reductase cytochrome b subunit n=1 Tax=Paeniglutamicibacter cryotolerans TaxID=670079 RepID=A0A839QLG5_9MICC|nr:succinate dehydrogenase cytochrome b subunit [Paeniglutamicibacter cryotolerans]MBB2996697.1 succinate dehydrogenase / fumarate reductase cytochrome b subunit [Paeniglutamicibacter cryotolerans]
MMSISPTRTRATASSSALHALMAVGGLIMVLFLLAHMYGNLKVFAGQEAFDGYSAYLRTVLEPLLPYGGALWILRVILLLSVGTHIWAAFVLWHRSRAATGGRGGYRYQSNAHRRGVQRSYSSFTMRWGGLTIALFVVYHLLHLTVNVISPGGASESPYLRMVNGFSIWWVVLSYAVALVALCLHLRHGIFSALASLGAATSEVRRRRFNQLAVLISAILLLGFLVPPLCILVGWVGP